MTDREKRKILAACDRYARDPRGLLRWRDRESLADTLAGDASQLRADARKLDAIAMGDVASAVDVRVDGSHVVTIEREHNAASRLLAQCADALRDRAAGIRQAEREQERAHHDAVLAPRLDASGTPRATYCADTPDSRASAGFVRRFPLAGTGIMRQDRQRMVALARATAEDAGIDIAIETARTRHSRKRKRRGKRGGQRVRPGSH
jgi:hypothetical protein